jgi:hypothetical protein
MRSFPEFHLRLVIDQLVCWSDDEISSSGVWDQHKSCAKLRVYDCLHLQAFAIVAQSPQYTDQAKIAAKPTTWTIYIFTIAIVFLGLRKMVYVC